MGSRSNLTLGKRLSQSKKDLSQPKAHLCKIKRVRLNHNSLPDFPVLLTEDKIQFQNLLMAKLPRLFKIIH